MKLFKRKNKDKLTNNKSGIYLTNEIRISPFSCENLPTQMAVMQMILVYVAVSSAISGFISTNNINASLVVLNIIYILITVVSYFLCSLIRNNRMFWPSLLYLFGILLLVYIRFNNIKDGFLCAVQAYLDNYNSYFDDSLKVIANENMVASSTEVFIYIGIIVNILVMYIMCCYMNKLLYFVFTLPWVIASFVVGYVPDTIPFFLYIIASFGMWGNSVIKSNYCVRDSKNKSKNNTKQKNFKDIAAINIAFSVIALVCIVFLGLNLFIRKDNYSESEGVNLQRDRLQNRFSEIEDNFYAFINGEGGWNILASDSDDSLFSDFLSDFSMGNGGIAKGKFSKSGISFKNKDKIQVVATNVNSTIYLKAFISSKYEDGWKCDKVPESDMDNELRDFAEVNSDIFEYGVVEISNLDESNIGDIIPSVPDTQYSINKKGLIEKSSSNKAMGFYQVDFDKVYNYYFNDEDRLGQFSDISSEYEKDIYEYYTNEPEDSVEDEVDNIIDELSNSINPAYDLKKCSVSERVNETLNIVKQVKNYLTTNYTYNLQPNTSSRLDPVVYFLKTSKEGYCMHFASAATLILQRLGIPTRYVEGYIVTDANYKTGKILYNKAIDYRSIVDSYDKLNTLDMYQMTVKDINAHAWIEVYFDNIGWVPVEVTGAAINGESVSDIIRDNYHIPTKNPSETVSPATNTPSNSPTQTQSVKPTSTSKDGNGANTVGNGNMNNGNSDNTGSKKDSFNYGKTINIIVKILMVIIFIGLIILAFIMRKRKIDTKNKKILESKDDTVKYMSKIINKLLESDNIRYNNNMEYMDYVKKISDNYKFIDYNVAKGCVEILLKECFSENGISKEEYEKIRDFYNKFINNTLDNMSSSKKWYYNNIICIMRQI